MFWRKKSAEDQVNADRAAIMASLGPKWQMFCEKIPFKADVPLAARIEAFAAPAMAGMFQHYPSTKSAPPGALWTMIFTAILESKTHPLAELNAAIAQLEAKFASA